MSRESARCRERQRAAELEIPLGAGAVVDLPGLRFIVLYSEPRRSGLPPAALVTGGAAANEAGRGDASR